ncbi:hypothetical protein SEVIR_5G041366v4 [Setaria viridis]
MSGCGAKDERGQGVRPAQGAERRTISNILGAGYDLLGFQHLGGRLRAARLWQLWAAGTDRPAGGGGQDGQRRRCPATMGKIDGEEGEGPRRVFVFCMTNRYLCN